MSDLTANAAQEVEGDVAHDAVDAGSPIKIGGYAKATAPTAVSADGDRVQAWFTTRGAQTVAIVDSSGNFVATGTQYVGDAAATATPTGTMLVGLANTSAPTDVSAANDAVALWASPKGALNVILRDTAGVAVSPVAAALADGTTNPTTSLFGAANEVFNGTTWDRMVSAQGVATGANTDRGIVAAAIGPGYSRVPADDSLASVTAGAAIDVGGAGSVALQITGGATATITFEASYDNTTYFTVSAYNVATAAWSTTTTANGNFLIPVLGYFRVRANMTARTSGTFTVHKIVHAAPWLGAVAGDVAHDAVDTGNPVKFGGYASSVVPTGVSTGDRVNAWFTLNGSLVVDGGVAKDAAITGGGPIMIGGRASTAVPTAVSADNDLTDFWLSRNGALNVILRDTAGTAAPLMTAAGDAVSNPTTMPVVAMPEVWDGSNWVRWRANSVGDAMTTGIAAVGEMLYDGTSTYARARAITALDASPNVDTGILAAGVGPGYDRKTNPTGVSATSTASAVTVVVDGADMIAFEVTTIGTTPGSMIFETEGDDSTWVTAGMVVKLATGPDIRIEGSFVPAVGDVYFVRTAGHRRVRYRVNAVYASGTATVKVTSVNGVAMVKSIDMAPPPHNIGYAETGISATFSSAQTSTTIGPTVAAGQRMVVTYVMIQSAGTTAGTATLYFGTGAFSRGTSKPIFDGEFAPSATLKPGFVAAKPTGWIGAADEELKLTTTNAQTITVTIWYYLVAA